MFQILLLLSIGMNILGINQTNKYTLLVEVKAIRILFGYISTYIYFLALLGNKGIWIYFYSVFESMLKTILFHKYL